jgi:hypothetical protein
LRLEEIPRVEARETLTVVENGQWIIAQVWFDGP